MSEPPTCFLDLPPDTVRLMLASLDIWTTAADDLAFVRWWNAMALSCRWLNSICKTYEPQMCERGKTWRNLNRMQPFLYVNLP